MGVAAKICGINNPAAMQAAGRYDAAMAGLVFFPASPRHLRPDAAAMLAAQAAPHLLKVGLIVDAGDDAIDRITDTVPLDILQLHGGETPDRCRAVRARTGCRIIKALAIGDAADIAHTRAYEGSVDFFLFDAKPPPDADRPGGNARAFDWSLATQYGGGTPWLLAGGLTTDNVQTAVRLSGATAVDCSSGVEDGPGRKNPDKIRAFLRHVGSL